MKIILDLELKKNQLPIDIRRAIISFFKYMSSDIEELYKRMYESGPVQKEFAFSYKINQPEFEENQIKLKDNKLQILFVTGNPCLAIDMYNGFSLKKEKEYPLPQGNYMKLIDVRIEKHGQILKSDITIKMMSPLVVRKHIKGERDYYFQFDESGFIETLNYCIKTQLKNINFQEEVDTGIDLKPVIGKRVLIKTMGIKIPASIGVYRLLGNHKVLTALYEMGMGSRRSEGFGVFEIVSGYGKDGCENG